MAASDALQEEDQLNLIGQHGAQLVDRLLEPGDIIGFSPGRAVRALVENLPQAGQSRGLSACRLSAAPPANWKAATT